MRHVLCVALLVGWLCTSRCLADAPLYPLAAGPSEPIGGDSHFFARAPGGALRHTLALGGPVAPSWSRADESWYRQNRAIATAGKVLTVLGISLSIASAFTREQAPLLLSGVGTQSLGQLIWGAAEVRGANELARRGSRVSNVAGIVALCGALLLSPLTWVAGPIQSAQIRRAHDQLTFGRGSNGPTFASYGLGFFGTF